LARVLLEIVLPFLAPFVAFYLYRLLVTRGQGFLERTPWSVLTALGLALACFALTLLAFMGGEPPGGEYVPPHVENGQIVPAEVRRPVIGR
jgi:predicted PurR-regulated permease PerM